VPDQDHAGVVCMNHEALWLDVRLNHVGVYACALVSVYVCESLYVYVCVCVCLYV
jgi:hypothetical protein